MFYRLFGYSTTSAGNTDTTVNCIVNDSDCVKPSTSFTDFQIIALTPKPFGDVLFDSFRIDFKNEIIWTCQHYNVGWQWGTNKFVIDDIYYFETIER
ncbi:hypothetical protein DLAC_01363 [Tieghemostelium lacteum]|uniref:Uncharacterized protein n=1 Tax=Tieghemostelium lacteum TaxID=361077 RepID=A0A152A8E4_TIELA|nr:hypothetical protein DLAC_01363 [Tieghemostelium lacteum]|eukprot:KYR02519.1 hypothetical protein DLAC_01363 [Tieghemostelium lacteum]